MAEFFDINAHRGLVYHTEDNQDGSITLRTTQNVQPILDHTQKERSSGANDLKGIKAGYWKYAMIPAHVELELRKKGIDIYDKNCTKRLIREINTNYPHLKTTNLHHEIK